jgi:hypothetical protein
VTAEAPATGQETQEREPAKFCGKCGAPLPIRGLPACFGCMTQDEAVATAQGLQKLALEVMRGWDRARAVTALGGAAERAAAALKTAQDGLLPLRAAVTETVAAERKAQDRARAAAGHSRKCADAERRAQREQGSPQRQTEALLRSRAAADVTQREAAALEGATAARVAAEQALIAHEGKVAAAEDAAAQAKALEASPPGQVPMSEWTAFTCHPALVLSQPGLGDLEKAACTLQVSLYAQLCGLEDTFRAEGRAAYIKEQEEALRSRPMHIKDVGNGQRVAVPNPLAPGTPQQFHPPARRP